MTNESVVAPTTGDSVVDVVDAPVVNVVVVEEEVDVFFNDEEASSEELVPDEEDEDEQEEIDIERGVRPSPAFQSHANR